MRSIAINSKARVRASSRSAPRASIMSAPTNASPYLNIFDLAAAASTSSSSSEDELAMAMGTFHRIFKTSYGHARCKVPAILAKKYQTREDNEQNVVAVTNRLENQMAFFNKERTKKPQTFVQKQLQGSSVALTDTTGNGERCDFCNWRQMTAEDSFGRIERDHAVSGSNLFKYGAPFHGLALFKHHDPLSFDLHQLADLLAVSNEWFEQARQVNSADHQGDLHSFFLWNSLARAGASQYHGHAQLMLTSDPLPIHIRTSEAQIKYGSLYPGQSYARDLIVALDQVGLAASISDNCFIAASPCPIKDMETIILGPKELNHPSFVKALFVSLRTLIDDLGVESFNVGIIKEVLEGRIVARIVSRGKVSQTASDFGALEVIGGASIGHTDPYVVIEAIRKKMTSLH